MRRRRFIFVSPRVLPRSGLLPGVCADMMLVPRRGSLRKTCIPLVYAEMPSGQQVVVAPQPWVGTTPWYQPTANEDIAPPAHQNRSAVWPCEQPQELPRWRAVPTRGARFFFGNTTLERSLRSDYVVREVTPPSLCTLFASLV